MVRLGLATKGPGVGKREIGASEKQNLPEDYADVAP
jgi:hypothetical protein